MQPRKLILRTLEKISMNTDVKQIRITSFSLNMLCVGQFKSTENMF